MRAARAILVGVIAFTGAARSHAQPATGDSGRSAALDRAIADLRTRAHQVAAASDRRAGETLVQLAESLLDRLALDASDTTALFGVLTTDQRAWVKALANEALVAATKAGPIIDAEIAEIEQNPAFSESRELQDERSRLSVELRELRLPRALGRAGVIAASVEPGAEARAAIAERAQRALVSVRFDDEAIEAERLVGLGCARLFGVGAAAGKSAPAGPDYFEAALSLTPDRSLPALAPQAYAEAILGKGTQSLAATGPEAARIYLRNAMSRPPFLTDAGPNVALLMVGTDVSFRIGVALAERAPEGPTKRQAYAEAFNTYAALLDRDDLGISYEARRALVFDKVAGLSLAGDPAMWPALPAIARANALARQESTRADGVRILESVTARPKEELGAAAPECLWELAVALLRDPACGLLEGREEFESVAVARARAMRPLIALFEGYPQWRRTGEAIHRACALGEVGASTKTEIGWGDRLRQRLDPEYTRALRLAVARPDEAPSINLWRLRLAERIPAPEAIQLLRCISPDAIEERAAACRLIARRLMEELHLPARFGGSVDSATADRAKQAIASVEDARTAMADRRYNASGRVVGPIADLPLYEARALLAVGQVDRAVEAVSAAQRRHEEGFAALDFIARTVCGWIGAAEAAQDDAERRRLAEILLKVADIGGAPAFSESKAKALVILGEAAEATKIYDSLLLKNGQTETLRLARAEALLAAGDSAAAFGAFRDLAGALEQAGSRNASFWRCERRILEILDSQNADASRAPAIRREVARLRAIDPRYAGGAPGDAERIAAIENKVGPG